MQRVKESNEGESTPTGRRFHLQVFRPNGRWLSSTRAHCRTANCGRRLSWQGSGLVGSTRHGIRHRKQVPAIRVSGPQRPQLPLQLLRARNAHRSHHSSRRVMYRRTPFSPSSVAWVHHHNRRTYRHSTGRCVTNQYVYKAFFFLHVCVYGGTKCLY